MGTCMSKVDLGKLIKSKEELFLKKLKHAGQNELEYWEKRPENLPREILVKYIDSINEAKDFFPEIAVRESDGGRFGKTGFKWVFKLKDSFLIIGRRTDIYLKGFFFEIDDPRGVEIQSFKKSFVLKKVK